MCGNNDDYCGEANVSMDFANIDETLILKPSGGSNGKKSFKNMICLWNV